MGFYYFYILSRQGDQLYYREHASRTKAGLQDESKLVFGLLFSLKHLAATLFEGEQRVRTLTTKTFALHEYETLTGYRFVLCTSLQADQAKVHAQLEHFYVELFCTKVMQNPAYEVGSKIQSDSFDALVDGFF